ncbi:MAG: hypothetical protein QOH81_1377 [Sphingomonadales bacterium]|jgi:hypothetical protein|nr:hypothetical protein [Sphingomonadales bacterium]
MFRPIAALGLLLVPAAAMAAPPSRQTVEQDGYRFEIATQLMPGGIIRIEGNMLDNGDPIRLAVDRSGYVSGFIGRAEVDFSIERAKRDQLAASLAPAPVLASASAAPNQGGSEQR